MTSEHRNQLAICVTMRILILSSFLACVAAAPSGALVGSLAPLPIPAISAIAAVNTVPVSPVIPAVPIIKTIPGIAAIPVSAPTISPGDIQAAAINAKVEAEDILRAAADKNREIAEQALKGQADKIVEATNIASEKNQEAFWEVEDKKWQALTAFQTAQAKIEGIVASNAELLGQAVIAPTPGVAPYAYSAVSIKTESEKAEEEKKEVKAENVSDDSVQVESAANEEPAVKTPAAEEGQFVALKTPSAVAENEKKLADEAKLKEVGVVAPVLANLGFPLYAPIAGVPAVNLNQIGWEATLLQPGVKILTPGISVAQGGLVATVAGKSSW